MPISSNAIERTNRIIIVRRARLTSRGDGRSAFTPPNKAAREKKLAASNPKNRMNSAANNRGRNPKKFEMCCSTPTMPSTFTPTRMNPSHATQKTKRLNISVGAGSSAPRKREAAPVCSDNLSKRVMRNTLRTTARRTHAISQPMTTSVSISKNRGRKRPRPPTISCMVRFNSLMKFCHIANLTSSPAKTRAGMVCRAQTSYTMIRCSPQPRRPKRPDSRSRRCALFL